jgi:membrane protein implicated in regulation of membrane protease activity
MNWWMWLGAGLVLLLIEVLTPGSLFWIFFAAGAFIVSLIALAMPSMGFAAQSIFFVGFSTLSLMLFRKPLLRWLEERSPKPGAVDPIVGETGVTLAEIPAGAVGKVELRGTTWSATNLGPTPIPVSVRCRIEKVDGLMLFIRGEA